jgi:hypothetical protein
MEKTHQIRELSTEEEAYLRQGEFKNRVKGLRPLSVIGPSYDPYIANYNVKISLKKVYLGGGQYIDEAVGWRKAPTGTILKFRSNPDDVYRNVFSHLESLGVIIITERNYPSPDHLLYFESVYFNVVVKGLKYADETTFKWNKNRSLMSLFFGDQYFAHESSEASSIRSYLDSLLLEVQKSIYRKLTTDESSG